MLLKLIQNGVKMRKLLTTALVVMLLVVASDLFAQLKITGDARFRPRLDIIDQTLDPKYDKETSNVYFMYRLRLNLNWKIGDGYFLQSRLGHNGLAGYGVFGLGEQPTILGVYKDLGLNSARMSLDIMLLNGGRATDTYGYKFGLFGADSYNNPIFDVHYYASRMIDIPFFIFSNDGLFGASGYYKAGPGKITLAAIYDRPIGYESEDSNGNELYSINDQYSFYVDYNIKVADWGVQPMAMMTVADSSTAPMTFGANITSPKLVGDLALGFSAIYSMNSVKNSEMKPDLKCFGMITNEYIAWKVRAKVSGKLGIGKLFAYIELGKRDDTFDDASTSVTDFLYSWLGYSFTIYSGDAGKFIITPQWRHMSNTKDDVNILARERIEMNFDFKF